MYRLVACLFAVLPLLACGGESSDDGAGGTAGASGGGAPSTGGTGGNSATGGSGSTDGSGSTGGSGSGGGGVCELPFEVGMCNAAFPVFWFDAAAGECVQKTYGGCGGNDNRFETLDACEMACGGEAVGSCGDASDCSTCLAQEGCSWTADQCADQCIADAACFGAGNPAAPACPQ